MRFLLPLLLIGSVAQAAPSFGDDAMTTQAVARITSLLRSSHGVTRDALAAMGQLEQDILRAIARDKNESVYVRGRALAWTGAHYGPEVEALWIEARQSVHQELRIQAAYAQATARARDTESFIPFVESLAQDKLGEIREVGIHMLFAVKPEGYEKRARAWQYLESDPRLKTLIERRLSE